MSQRNNISKSPYWLIIGAAMLLLITVFLWSCQSPSPDPVAAVQQPAASHDEETYPDIPRVSIADAKLAFDANSAVFLDVRDADSFAAGHIPGSVNIPLSSLATGLSNLDPAAWIITYCT